jgi:hypothetical protein
MLIGYFNEQNSVEEQEKIHFLISHNANLIFKANTHTEIEISNLFLIFQVFPSEINF